MNHFLLGTVLAIDLKFAPVITIDNDYTAMTNKWPCPLIENNINESGCGEDDEDCGSSSGNELTPANENKIPGKALFQWSSFKGYKSVSSHFSHT